ncbi:MAG: nucleotide pyrophosphohydrolase [Candidatus Hodarchaeales archaeon]
MNEKNCFKELQKLVSDFIENRDWTKYHTPKNLAMSIAIEAAELMEIFQWLTNPEAQEIALSDEETRAKIKDEIADVVIYCLSLCERTNINLEEAIRKKMQKNEKRFPTHIVSGKLGPYNIED